jgi:lipid II:glycine glycyltransferase (peptidoglycan interpeptide bridge formation enzyme)
MDLRPSMEELERGFHQKWRKSLNRARKNNLEIIEGQDESLFESLRSVYGEMLQRKRFDGQADIEQFKRAQQTLAPSQKMRVILCSSEGEIVAGALFSALGDTGLDLYRATSNRGISTYGSYLVQWRVLEYLKSRGCTWYNLNGINRARNPGGYQFKSHLAGKNGREVGFLGPFDAYPNMVIRTVFTVGDRLNALRKRNSRQTIAESGNAPQQSNEGSPTESPAALAQPVRDS